MREGRGRCPSPPEFVVSVLSGGGDEYMVGVVCGRHRGAMGRLVRSMQGGDAGGRLPAGAVRFSAVRPVGTDCLKGECGSDSCS